jgi:hypothetical protein
LIQLLVNYRPADAKPFARTREEASARSLVVASQLLATLNSGSTVSCGGRGTQSSACLFRFADWGGPFVLHDRLSEKQRREEHLQTTACLPQPENSDEDGLVRARRRATDQWRPRMLYLGFTNDARSFEPAGYSL